MHRIGYYLPLLLFICLWGACQKEPLTAFETRGFDYGIVAARINGAEWVATPFVDTFHLNDKIFFDFIADTFSEEGFLRDDLDIGPIPLQKGSYDVTSKRGECGNINLRSFFFLLAADGDALAATYYIDDNKKNTIEVEEVDLLKGKIKGNFSLNFVLSDRLAPGFEPPEKLKIRKGFFDLTLL